MMLGLKILLVASQKNMAPSLKRRREGVPTRTSSSGVVLETTVGMMTESVASIANEMQISSISRGGEAVFEA
jgi:hypothetical protein